MVGRQTAPPVLYDKENSWSEVRKHCILGKETRKSKGNANENATNSLATCLKRIC